MSDLLAFEADRRAVNISINSIGTELTRDDRRKLYSNFGLLYPYGHEELTICEDLDQGVQGAEHPDRVRGAGRGATPFTWSGFKRSDLSGEVERLEARIEVLTKQDAEWDSQIKIMTRRDTERELQMKRMEQMMEELMRGRSLS